MFDCGVHPAHSGMSCLPYFDHINPQEAPRKPSARHIFSAFAPHESYAQVDLLLVTHFHLDHSGAVPLGRPSRSSPGCRVRGVKMHL